MDRSRRTFIGVIVFVAIVSVACGADEAREAGPERINESALDQAFVAFTETRLTLEVGRAVPPPVTVGSTASAATLRSADPRIVDVASDGVLVPRSSGNTIIHGTRGAQLAVEVLEPAGLEIRGALTHLQPGDEVELSVVGPRGEVAVNATVWGTSDPKVARVGGGTLHAVAPGKCSIVAKHGPALGRRTVVVGDRPAFTVTPPRSRARVGALLMFDAIADSRPILPAWSASDKRVLRPLGHNVFEAVRKGNTQVCASAFNQQVCVDVEVVP